jgi:hypothetical protein
MVESRFGDPILVRIPKPIVRGPFYPDFGLALDTSASRQQGRDGDPEPPIWRFSLGCRTNAIIQQPKSNATSLAGGCGPGILIDSGHRGLLVLKGRRCKRDRVRGTT